MTVEVDITTKQDGISLTGAAASKVKNLLDPEGRLVGAVMLPKLVLAQPSDPLLPLSMEPLISCHAGANEKEVAEIFDKYNLLTLPVVEDEGKLTGVITSDDVISLLRAKL